MPRREATHCGRCARLLQRSPLTPNQLFFHWSRSIVAAVNEYPAEPRRKSFCALTDLMPLVVIAFIGPRLLYILAYCCLPSTLLLSQLFPPHSDHETLELLVHLLGTKSIELLVLFNASLWEWVVGGGVGGKGLKGKARVRGRCQRCHTAHSSNSSRSCERCHL